MLAFPLTPTFTCVVRCVVVLGVVVSKLKESGTAKLAAWLGAGPRSASAFGVAPRYVRNGGAIGGKPRCPPREQNALGRPPPSPSTGDPTRRVSREGATQNQGTVPVAGGDMSLLISFLQTLGLPQEVMSQVESKLAPPREKEISDEKALALAKANLDRVVAQKNKLNRTVVYHTAKLREVG